MWIGDWPSILVERIPLQLPVKGRISRLHALSIRHPILSLATRTDNLQLPTGGIPVLVKMDQCEVGFALALNDSLMPPGATFFDYGCGRGGDIQRLQALGYDAAGWDPAHYARAEQRPRDVVNLGYVANVIEDPRERADALQKAWALTKGILVVAARTDWVAARVTGRSRGDGIVTSKGTFQKFFSHEELRYWIDGVLAVRSMSASSRLGGGRRNRRSCRRWPP